MLHKYIHLLATWMRWVPIPQACQLFQFVALLVISLNMGLAGSDHYMLNITSALYQLFPACNKSQYFALTNCALSMSCFPPSPIKIERSANLLTLVLFEDFNGLKHISLIQFLSRW